MGKIEEMTKYADTHHALINVQDRLTHWNYPCPRHTKTIRTARMGDQPTTPIFFDPKNRRWGHFKLTTFFIGLIFTVILLGLIISVMITPSLPSVSLAPVRELSQDPIMPPTVAPTATAPPTEIPVSPQDIPTSSEQGIVPLHVIPNRPDKPYHFVYKKVALVTTSTASETQTGEEIANATPAPTPTPTQIPTLEPMNPKATGKTDVIGFFVNWDDNSFSSLKQNVNNIDKLIPEWLHLSNASGSIVVDDPVKQQDVINFLSQTRPTLPIIPLVNNYSNDTQSWEDAALSQMLADPAARAKNIQSLLDYVQSNHFAGISIDYETTTANPAELTEFMKELYNKFHPLGLEVSQSVPVDDPNYDYPSLAQYNDYLILMAYDENWSGSTAGPVASQQFIVHELQTRFEEVNPSKYVVALGNYGYDWQDGASQGNEISFQQAVQLAANYKVTVRFDPASLNPTFDYTDANGSLHHVWYLDGISAFDQIMATHQYPIHGIGLWRMGSEDPAIWNVFQNRDNLDNAAANTLDILHYGFDIVYQGTGEILKVTGVSTDGKRAINYNTSSGLITNEQFLSFPSPYVITRWGGTDKNKIAITFDDGPDRVWTPQILKILKQYNVPATFFVIGSNANANPNLIKQEIAQGDEIGNHTFTHPDISIISPEQLLIEVNATQRVFESVLGLRTVLFRPPYSEDTAPTTPEQVKPLLATGQLGYLTVDTEIDPSDYLRPGVQTIVQRVIDQTASGQGNVVLLHDSGGDRSQTVAALPLIIQGLRARGYQLVSVSDLLGLPRDQVMPPITSGEKFLVTVSGIGFQTTDNINKFLSAFFVLGIVLGLFRFLSVAILAILEKWRERGTKYPEDFRPTLSIIVPAYNESKIIEKTIKGLLHMNYPVTEIIVVDDGSTDQTYERVIKIFGNTPKVHAFHNINAGKAQALNFGIATSKGEIILAMDADTIIHPDAAALLVRHFADPRVGAVAGNAKVGNRVNLLTYWQALEYITSQNLDRQAFALLNSISVVPGAIGAWRRSLLLQLGGFNNDTLAEDADMTLEILRNGYRVEYESKAIAYTEAPDTVSGFLKQRFRWMYGTLQAAWKHRDTLFKPKYGALGLAAMPNILVFQVFFPFISPLMDLVAFISVVNIYWKVSQHPMDPTPTGLATLLFFYLIFLCLDFATALFAFMLEKDEDWRLIIWIFLQRFFYRQLMYDVAIRSLITAIRGRLVGWGKLERKATIQMRETH